MYLKNNIISRLLHFSIIYMQKLNDIPDSNKVHKMYVPYNVSSRRGRATIVE
jgi:hypothetical protein